MPDTLTLPTVTGGPHTVPELMTAGGAAGTSPGAPPPRSRSPAASAST